MVDYRGRCMKCKTEVKIENPKATQWSNGMWVATGKCGKCGTGVNRIIGKSKPANL